MKDALQKITGEVVAYDNGWIYLGSFTKIPQDIVDEATVLVEANEHEILAKEIREERDRKMLPALNRIQRYQLQKDSNITTTDSSAMYYGLLDYVQELRDITEQSTFPNEVIFPEEPTEETIQDFVPKSVTRRQARLALHEVGKLELVEQAVAQAGVEASIEFDADSWERSNIFLQTLWIQLGGTTKELDQLYQLAATK